MLTSRKNVLCGLPPLGTFHRRLPETSYPLIWCMARLPASTTSHRHCLLVLVADPLAILSPSQGNKLNNKTDRPGARSGCSILNPTAENGATAIGSQSSHPITWLFLFLAFLHLRRPRTSWPRPGPRQSNTRNCTSRHICPLTIHSFHLHIPFTRKRLHTFT